MNFMLNGGLQNNIAVKDAYATAKRKAEKNSGFLFATA